MAIDYWRLSKEFAIGDFVQRYAPGQGSFSLSPFMGRVTAVHRGLGVLDVQFPYGNERVFPDDVVKVDARLSQWLPPETLDQTYMSLDTQRAREIWATSNAQKMWRSGELPVGFYRDLSFLWAKGAGEVRAYDELWRKHAASVADHVLRDEVAKFYRVASRLTDARIQQHTMKTAAYWVAQNRQYRMTSEELQVRKPGCPKCGTRMRRTTYKMDKGARHRLFACPKDLFLIKVTDMLGPEGQPVEW